MFRNARAGSPGEFAEGDVVGISWIIRRTGEAKPTTKGADVSDAGHGTQICPSVPLRRRHWNRLRSNFIGQGSQEGRRPKNEMRSVAERNFS